MRFVVLGILFFIISPNLLLATCQPNILNPFTHVAWSSVFPIKLGGAPLNESSVSCDIPAAGETPVCACPAPPPVYKRIGVSLSFWQPDRYVETVGDAWCFPSLGTQIAKAMNDGSQTSLGNSDSTLSFFQAHYFTFPVQEIMSQFIDKVCLSNSGFDVAYLTEVDPLWNNDSLSALINPEAILTSNPAAQLACAADSVSSNLYCSNSAMYWCQGSQGTSYPLTGSVPNSDELSAGAAVAGKMIFKLGRQGMLFDSSVNPCYEIPTPIWIKHNYRLQVAMPIPDFTAHPIGRGTTVWGAWKKPSVVGKNLVWMIFRRKSCCAL